VSTGAGRSLLFFPNGTTDGSWWPGLPGGTDSAPLPPGLMVGGHSWVTGLASQPDAMCHSAWAGLVRGFLPPGLQTQLHPPLFPP
jgi:hypothetical protein